MQVSSLSSTSVQALSAAQLAAMETADLAVLSSTNLAALSSAQLKRLKHPFEVFQIDAVAYPGNSGSPVVNRAGEFVGIIFDGNIQSLVGDFAYEDTQARAISVDCRAIIEALRKVYRADALTGELLAGRRAN